MTHNTSQKRILLLYKWLLEETDADHPIASTEILQRWEDAGVPSDRRSVYKDVETLLDCGVAIEMSRTITNNYYLSDREFSLGELKILIDAVEACQIIPNSASRHLVKKLTSYAIAEEKAELRRPVYVDKVYKTGNTNVFDITDVLYEAIREKKKVKFNYTDFAVNRSKIYRHDKAVYTLSPYFLKWNSDRYYVIGWSDEHQNISHFRIDRIGNLYITEEKAEKKPTGLDPEKYGSKVFGMFGGKSEMVTLRCTNERMRDIVDKFGMRVPVEVVDESHFDVMVEVEPSPPFFGWIFQFGGDVQIIAPENIKEEMSQMASSFTKNCQCAP